jgi:hypothetical protein
MEKRPNNVYTVAINSYSPCIWIVNLWFYLSDHKQLGWIVNLWFYLSDHKQLGYLTRISKVFSIFFYEQVKNKNIHVIIVFRFGIQRYLCFLLLKSHWFYFIKITLILLLKSSHIEIKLKKNITLVHGHGYLFHVVFYF